LLAIDEAAFEVAYDFGRETFRDGVKRVVNGHISFARSRLCVKQ
jgi:hypothetical protein